MNLYATCAPIPLDSPVDCLWCDQHLTEEAFFVDDAWFCEACCREYLDEVKKEADAFAAEHCKIVEPPHQYDPQFKHSCTPEEYEAGAKESYTANSVAAFNRHNCTNYDELIAHLDRFNPADTVYYLAIRERIEELLEEPLLSTLSSEEDDEPNA